jgi:branched-chain amino acid transport system substrate-binding protein
MKTVINRTKKNMKFIAPIFILLMAVSCDSNSPANEREKRARAATGDIRIGAVGNWASDNDLSRKGIKMAGEEINAAGGILGRKLHIAFYDDEGSVPKSKRIAQELVENFDIVAVIGHSLAHATVSVAANYQYHGLLLLSPMSTSTELVQKGFNLIFSSISNDDHFAQSLVEYAANKGYDRLMIYSDRDSYGTGLANAFENHAAKKGIRIVDRRTYDKTTSVSRFKFDAREWVNFFDFDGIFIAGRWPQGAEFIIQARQEGIDVPIMGGSLLKSTRLIDVAGAASEGLVVASAFDASDPDPVSKKFSVAFDRKYGTQPNAGAAQSYDAVKLLFHAMDTAGSSIPRKVAQALSQTRDWRGVTGFHSFGDMREVVDKKLDLSIVSDGSFTILKETETRSARTEGN